MRFVQLSTVFSTLCFALLLACGGARAAYPERPVRLIVGQPAGDTTDLVARVTAPALAEFLGQPFVIDNHPGANGNLAAARAVKAKADGYTLLLVSTSFATNPSLYPALAQQPLRDFAGVSRVATVQNVLVVHASSHVKNLRDFIAAVRSSPGKLVFASGGNGSLSHLAAELLKVRAGPLNTLHVPYKSSAAALTELVGGHVDALFVTMPYAFAQVKNGRLRAVAVGSLKRAAGLPDVPTVDESGIRGYEAVLWNAIVAPAGTGYETVVRLGLAVNHASESALLRQKLAAMGAEPAAETPDQFVEYLRGELEKWTKVVKAGGVTVD
jgi:tripartite-type tricarboxylate transporter receptor subunit TctC